MVLVGLISYPLYLWHWPLLAYARIAEGGEPSAALRVALLALSMVLAWLTYRLLERPIRQSRRLSVKRIAVPALAASMTALAVTGVLAVQSRLYPHSASVPLVREISAASTDWSYRGDRVIPGDSPKAVLFFGDSHMQHYWPRVHKIVSERAAPVRTVIFKTTGGCAPVPGIERKGQQCSQFVAEGLAIARRPEVETVVLAASWTGFVSRGDYYRVGDPQERPLELLSPDADWVLRDFAAALRELAAAGKEIVLVLSSPRGSAFDPKSVIQRDGMTVQVSHPFAPVPRSKLVELTSPIDARLIAVAAAAGAAVIDPTQWLCSGPVCPTVDERGRPLYKDASHLRASVARERFPALDKHIYLR
jgi:hypothetical protein